MESRVVGGRYLLLAELDRRGFGPAFRAEDRITGRQVVVTEIRLPDPPDRPDSLRDRLLTEVRTAGRLRHPGVVPVQDLVADRARDGSLREHLVTERPEARSLSEALADGPMPVRTVAAVGRDVLVALRAMHDSGVVHGGLTPDCVLLTTDGSALVTDIGLARAVGPRPVGTNGSVDPGAFAAPERGAGGSDAPSADLWALGAVLHHAVGRRPPANGPLTEVITGLTAADPAERLGPAEAAVLLERAARPRPTSGDLGRSRRLLLGAAAVLALIVIGLLVLVIGF
ncbi:serine/threonine-protein kinase [Pseudonocardia endophytica]|uniref:non-specific serine/threonine protein kinase n=1 Tax=Pseudonocardia endophytica TaxID=401976 RepID=A0A4R1HSR9_PSEEN|nr:serine/threonine-protein kinase [Pseudonocardia endophytica]TCK20442.1 protein kinase-like protein [Pseudonocardia endophytica]